MSKKDTCIFMFGRMNPVHIGHGYVFEHALQLEKDLNADLKLFLSATVDDVKNPLPLELKQYYINEFYPDIGKVLQGSKSQLFDIMKELDGKYHNIIFVGGSDRKDEFQKTLDRYNGSLYNFSNISTVMAGSNREQSTFSSTMMRNCARNLDFENFSLALPGNDEVLKHKMFVDVYERIRK